MAGINNGANGVVNGAAAGAAASVKPKKKMDLSKMEIKMPDFKEIWANIKNLGRKSKGAEINLVPDVKEEMIKTLKLRNFIFFICIVVAGASVAVTLVFGSIAGGQQAAVNGKKEMLATLSDKVNSYSDLSDFLTIKDQLSNLSSIGDNKKLLSRTFGVIAALLPHGADTITLSELSINLSGDAPTISFDAQANANSEPYIDYNVLDAFKKSMQYMRYDFGKYVDQWGEEIPAYCMIENATNGATFSDAEKGYFAYWLINGEGCNPSLDEEEEVTDEEADETVDGEAAEDEEQKRSEEEARIVALGYTPEEYNGQTVVRIWRTPQFNDWYKNEKMDLYGNISNVAHFESECNSYTGSFDDNDNLHWSTVNESCKLVPDGIDGIRISDSSNGRGAGDELVLRFSATITLSDAVYSFENKHLMAIAPSGRYNVTDSYVQIQNMFEERAADCAVGDTACNGNTGGR